MWTDEKRGLSPISLFRGADDLAPLLHIGPDDGEKLLGPVADGIELHVRSDSAAARESVMIAIRESVRAALGREDVR